MKNNSNVKQVILVRKDLKMKKGKLAAQVAHASLASFISKNERNESDLNIKLTEADKEWLDVRFTKVCLAVESEEELISIYEKAKELGIKCSLIEDAGFTVFNEPTNTTVGLGPANNEVLRELTGHLKLL